MKKNIGVLFMALYCSFMLTTANAVELNGAAYVNVTSTTAADAKKQAMNQARRQIIFDALSKYANTDALHTAIDSSDTETLMNLVASSGIGDERQSNTTYSANITMKLDQNAVIKWLNNNDIPNTLESNGTVGNFDVVIELTKPISQWHELRDAARAENIDLNTKSIQGRNEITVSIPFSSRRAFINMLSRNGWTYENRETGLYVLKK